MPRPAAPNIGKLSTRETILRTAETLFAAKGIDAVSLNEINKAAGQKNTSSLHYHFGSKEDLIEAIVYFHYEEIEDKLQAALDALEAQGSFNYRQLIEKTIIPFVDKLGSERGVNYLLIVTQLLIKSADMLLIGHSGQKDKARLRLFSLFDRIAGDMPNDVKMARLILFSSLMFHSLASFAQFEKSGKQNPLGNKEFFVENLTAMLVAMIGAEW
jgi:AcrR family transcriptional regulator